VMDRIIAARDAAAAPVDATFDGILGKALNSRSPSRVDRGLAAQTALLRDLADTMKYGSLCALGGFTPYPVLSALDHFPEDFGAPTPLSEAAE
jgi:formate dehydrogenase iron-sulfur subunit